MSIKSVVDDVCCICDQPIGVRQKAIFLAEVVTKSVGSNSTNGKLGILVTNLKGFKKLAHEHCIPSIATKPIQRMMPITPVRRDALLTSIPKELINYPLQIDYPEGVRSCIPSIPAGYCEGYEYFAHAIMTGQKIAAIKMFRNFTGCGLKDSKDTVEANTDKWKKIISRII